MIYSHLTGALIIVSEHGYNSPRKTYVKQQCGDGTPGVKAQTVKGEPRGELCGEGFEVEAVVFDDGVGEELVAHVADLLRGSGLGVGIEGDFHVLAGADAGYAFKSELEKAAAYGLALRVADCGAKLDIDFGEVHGNPNRMCRIRRIGRVNR